MRSLATYAGAFALALAMAPGVAARKRVFTIGNWTQTAVGEKPMPMDRLVRIHLPWVMYCGVGSTAR